MIKEKGAYHVPEENLRPSGDGSERTKKYDRSAKLPPHGITHGNRPLLIWLNRCFAVPASSEKQFPTLSSLFGKLPDDALENLSHAGIATRAVSVAGVGEVRSLALLASMPFVIHTPLFPLRRRLEAPELVGYLATSEERFKHGGLTLSQCFGYLLLH
jgi:hypothetical protein